MAHQQPQLRTVKQFAEAHPAFSQGSLRWLIFNANSRPHNHGQVDGNGMEQALVRVGRRVLIDETKFFEWITSQQGGSRAW